ncbi:MAG: hypothetical protein F8N38_09275 [Hungatella sp.]|nr:hypothetical protein [Hungatella sp.]
MMIRSNNHMTDFRTRFQVQNVQFKSVINSLNTNYKQKKPSFDLLELSLDAIKSQKTETKNPDKLIDYKNSPFSGSRTEAEWAESSLTQQRDGLNSIRNELEYQLERLNTTLSKIDEYEKIANGDTSQTEPSVISQNRADELVNKYKESIKTDYSKEIETVISFYSSWTDNYDKYSNGLASKVMGNGLKDISAKSLGLKDLSDDPDTIRAALSSAIDQLKVLSKSVEDQFYQASGKKMAAEVYSDPEIRNKRMELENASLEMAVIKEDTSFTGQILKIDDTIKF